MAHVLVSNLPDDVIERLNVRAMSKGHSLEQELREIVMAAAPSEPLPVAERLAIIDRFLALSKRKAEHDSTTFIRVDRDER